jgi:hypothetical protein
MTKNWSNKVTTYSRALILEPGVFTFKSAIKIAKSLKYSADHKKNNNSTSLQSAMSMLNFYINRAGNKLSSERLKILNNAKIQLRKLYNKN